MSSAKSSCDSIDVSFSVSWTHRLRFTRNAFLNNGTLTSLLQELQPIKFFVIVDSGVVTADHSFIKRVEDWMHQQKFECFDPIVVEGGEQAKNSFSVVDQVLEFINNNQICRCSCAIVVGGGAILDAVGYACSIAHRGIGIIRIPSTTLSACDSGVGVKNGINYFGKKNFIGVFDPPIAVVNDLSLLSTLNDRDWRSGLSEAVKVAIVKDRSFFDKIESLAPKLLKRDSDAIAEVINQSAKLHFVHITEGGDPFERLDARPLDFGHWSAHKLEQLANYELTHGEAVAIGLAIDLKCSTLLGLMDGSVATRIIELLRALGLPTSHPIMGEDALLDGIEEFRQHLGGELTLLMLTDIGQSTNVHTLDHNIVRQAIKELL